MVSGDTIAAVSSAAGRAARMIVRLSGPGALAVAGVVADPLPTEGGSAARLRLRFAGLAVPAWAYVFLAPRSYSGEDLVEFHLPGNPLLAETLLAALVTAGARHAEPGEYTARAYFNGRLDLTAAEGVAATIAAHGEGELVAARQLMAGELARRLRPVTDAVAETLALVEVGIDFSDEDVSFLPPAEAARRVAEAARALRALLADSARFEQLSHEPRFVLVGRPNAGKSTLLNALAGHERAVTSAVAGTTRDVLTAEVVLARGLVRLTDVAGLEGEGVALDLTPESRPEHPGSPAGGAGDDSTRSPVGGDAVLAGIEARMRAQALGAAAEADFVILVWDATDPRPPLDMPRPPDLTVRTKADLSPHGETDGGAVWVSAATGWNLPALRDRLDRLAFGAPVGRLTLALNARHLAAIGEAAAALDRAAGLAADASPEVLALGLREALDALGGVLGQVTPDDLIGRIFSAFCIGK